MSDHLRPLTDHELAFIRDRGTDFGKGGVWQRKADAAEAFADGWLIVEGGLRAKGIAKNDSQKAARIFTDAAWLEWHRNKSIWWRLLAKIGFSVTLVSLLITIPAIARHQVYAPVSSDKSCPGDRVVWVNTRTGVYHMEGERWYGRTKQGQFECEKAAKAEGDRETRNGQ